MQPPSGRTLAWLLLVPVGVVLLVCAAAVVAARTSTGREAAVRLAAARTHHPIDVRGGLEWQIASGRLRIVARQVDVADPPWMPGGHLARLGSVTLTYDLSAWHLPRLRAVELRDGVLEPRRDREGKSNWTLAPPRDPPAAGGGFPALRSLVLDDVHVRLQDERRHLDFDGRVATPSRDDGRFQLDAEGRLNGRDARFTLTGTGLATATPGKPWSFELVEESSGSRLTASGTLASPLNLATIDATFKAQGADLRDLYYLVGVRLPDTGRFTFDGRFLRDEARFEFRDLALSSGASDLSGSIVASSSGKGIELEAKLHSRVAHLRDVGKGAAGRRPPPEGPPRLFADWHIPLEGLRMRNARIDYHADELRIGPLTLRDASIPVHIEAGRLVAEPLRARTEHGEAKGRITFDARTDHPRATARLEADGIELAEMLRKPARPSPPVSGPLGASLDLEGSGDSFHELFASSHGRFRLTLPSGELRAALAEAVGLDLRALGLKLTHQDDRVELRCGVLDARVGDGKAQADRLVIDTEPVELTGSGVLSLDSEALDVTLRPKAKRPGLRLRTPLRIEGRLLQPAPRLEGRSIGRQGAAATALGVLVAPVAAAAAFIDPGRGRDADCRSLLAAKSD